MTELTGKRWVLLVGAFVVAAALSVFFAVRFGVSIVYWSDPSHIDQAFEGWMTPRYVARSWDLPPDVVADALALEQDGAGRRVTLEEIARASGQDLPALFDALEGAITDYRTRSGE